MRVKLNFTFTWCAKMSLVFERLEQWDHRASSISIGAARYDGWRRRSVDGKA
jgi:hypothetical protein